MQSHARVVVVGGGCVGVNILHELARRGWNDALLIERRQLTSGSTWHAAGLIPIYSFSYSFGRLIAKSIEIYEALEAETGHPVGWHKCGQLRVANSRERMDEYLNYASIAETQGVRAEILGPAEVRELWPLFEGHRDLLGGVYNPDDGHIAPADVTQAAAAGARDKGAKIHQETRVTAIEAQPGGEWRVRTDRGDVVCEHVVIATGSYARETAAMVGLDIPAVPVLHQYWVTETVPELVRRHAEGRPEMPVLRDESINGYVREEGDSLMFGPYEPPEKLEHFALDGVPEWFGADLLPEDMEAVEAHWETAIELVPALGRAGIRRNVRGPICTTPDNLPLVGPAWGLRNFWLAQGCSGGILMGGGIGHYLSEWMIDGEPGIDLSEIDCRRFGAYANKRWTAVKAREAFGHNFGIHYPGYEWPAGRPNRSRPLPRAPERAGGGVGRGLRLGGAELVRPARSRGARRLQLPQLQLLPPRRGGGARGPPRGRAARDDPDGEVRGERPGGGGLARSHPREPPAPGARAHRALPPAHRQGHGALRVHGDPARRRPLLPRRHPARRAPRLRHAVARPAPRRQRRACATRAASGAASRWWARGRARCCSPSPTATSATTPCPGCAPAPCRWASQATCGCCASTTKGSSATSSTTPSATSSLSSTPSSRRARGTGFASPATARSSRCAWTSPTAPCTGTSTWSTARSRPGLDRFVKLDGNRDFVGRAALERQRAAGLERRMVTLKVDTVDADAYMNEGVYASGCGPPVGRVTSGAYSHTLGHSISMAYVGTEHSRPGTELEIPLLGERRPATVIEDSPYDPANRRPRM